MALLQPADSTDEITIALQRLLQGDFEARWDAAKQMVRLGPAVLPLLLTLLPQGEGDLDHQAESTVVSSDKELEGGIHREEELEDGAEDVELHWFVARILGDLKHPVAVDALLHLVQTARQPEVASIAATSLAKSGDLALPALTELLQCQETRILAVQALAQVGHANAIPALLSVVTDTDKAVRAVAVEALTAFRDPLVTPILAEALDDTSSAVRLAALRGIGSRGGQLPQIEALVSRVAELLGDLNLEVGCQAAIALGRLKTPASLAYLEAALQHELMPVPLKLQVVRALGWSDTPVAIESLQRYLKHQFEASRSFVSQGPVSDDLVQHPAPKALSLEVVRVLGRIRNPELRDVAANVLLENLGSVSSIELQAAMALSLGQLGLSQAFIPLVQLLSHSDSNLRFHVLAALKRLNPEGCEQLQSQKNKASEPLAEGIAFALEEWHSA